MTGTFFRVFHLENINIYKDHNLQENDMKKLLNLRISDADRDNVEIIRKHGYNLSAFLRYCLRKKADEFRRGGQNEEKN